MKLLVAGLGNIGEEYKGTRHNIGFSIIDYFQEKYQLQSSSGRYADYFTTRIKNKEVIFIKPTTYMNLSGKAVSYWMKKYDIPVENLLVIVDDVALPLGKIRIKPKGSDGGHNGLFDIIESLGTSEFARLRFGIGNNFYPGKQVEYVLGKWEKSEMEILAEKIPYAHDAVVCWALEGISQAMSKFNRK